MDIGDGAGRFCSMGESNSVRDRASGPWRFRLAGCAFAFKAVGESRERLLRSVRADWSDSAFLSLDVDISSSGETGEAGFARLRA